MHANTFCKYRKKLLASPRVHLVSSFFCYEKNYLMSSLAMSVRLSVVCGNIFGTRLHDN